MYTLVGERTMAKLTFSNMFSWMHGFLENKQQCISNRNGYRNDLSKRPKKVASPDATINPDSYQWKITTSTAVAMTAAANSKATNPAILPDSTGSEATFHTTHVCEIPENTSAPPSSPMSNGPISYMTKGFDKGHLHCALPICSLLPKENTHTYNTGKVRHAKPIKPASNMAATTQQTVNFHSNQYLQSNLMETDKEKSTWTGYIYSQPAMQPSHWSEEQFTDTQESLAMTVERSHKLDPNHPITANLSTEDFQNKDQSPMLDLTKQAC